MGDAGTATREQQIADIHGIKAAERNLGQRNVGIGEEGAFLAGINSLGIVQIDGPAGMGNRILKIPAHHAVILGQHIISHKPPGFPFGIIIGHAVEHIVPRPVFFIPQILQVVEVAKQNSEQLVSRHFRVVQIVQRIWGFQPPGKTDPLNVSAVVSALGKNRYPLRRGIGNRVIQFLE